MAKPAAYVTLQDEPVTLQTGGDVAHVFKFDTPDVDAGRESVLSFVADPFGDNTVSLEWDLNGTNILTESFNTAPARALQEIVGKDLLKATGNKLKDAGDRHRQQRLDQDRRRRSDVHPEGLNDAGPGDGSRRRREAPGAGRRPGHDP